MFPAWILLVLNSLFFTLRLSGGGTGSFPRPLRAEEERLYLERMAQGDVEARNLLIEHNLRLVAHIVKKYYTPTGDQDDLISIGTIGLIKAISTFDGSKGARLATYAGRCIQNEILMYFRSQRKSAGDISLSDAIETGQDGSSLSVMDVLSSDEDLFQQTHLRSETKKLMGLLDRTLTPREKQIITWRYGLFGTAPLAQRQVAEKLGISRSYVSRIEKKALEKLRDAMEEPERDMSKDLSGKIVEFHQPTDEKG